MTIIIGLVENGITYMGCDSGAIDPGWGIAQETMVPKMFWKGMTGTPDGALIGYTTSFRMGQIIHHMVDFPEYNKNQMNPQRYMVCCVVEEIRSALKDCGYSKIESNREEGGTIMVGFDGSLFTIRDDFHVEELKDNFSAIGSGYQLALGSMKALEHIENPIDRVTQSLAIVDYFSAYVRGPFEVASV